MGDRITLRDIDNRGDGGAPYEFTGDRDAVAGYLDGPLRRDLIFGGAGWLDEAIRLTREGDLGGANALLNPYAAVYLSRGGER